MTEDKQVERHGYAEAPYLLPQQPVTSMVALEDYLGVIDDQGSGKVDVYLGKTFHRTLNIPSVLSMAGSQAHVIFLTAGNDPIYAIGSNRFSQLGMDYHTVQSITVDPEPVTYFSGLSSQQGTVACGLFHSAVLLDGDLYTFGWRKDGRLGRPEDEAEDDDIVGLAIFLNEEGEEVEINAMKIACGATHTLIVDDKGFVWSCGSSKLN
ncbi:hypothetical protein EC973_008420 [Apophysomyces ossiformis]|uniref:Regulator of chromosome condensation n=1 Tax=Apophysomyces ossiformis TaxID=679940 RepID=A0A8H7BQN5_9FUNG|nr:hypothetical protein EC973_008420 [Apophysomyces ossiformis]